MLWPSDRSSAREPHDLGRALSRAHGRLAAPPERPHALSAHLLDLASVVRAVFLTRLAPGAARQWTCPHPRAQLDPGQLALLVASRGLAALCPPFQAGLLPTPPLRVVAGELPDLFEQLGASRAGARASPVVCERAR